MKHEDTIALHADLIAWAAQNRIEPTNYSHQAVAIMLNGYSKNGAGMGKKSSWDHMPLFNHLSHVALALDQVPIPSKAPCMHDSGFTAISWCHSNGSLHA